MELTRQQRQVINSGRFLSGVYKGENVRIESHDRDSFYLFIPSRQEHVWVNSSKVENR